ncbi:MAG TPA: nucleoside deaminase [Thioalkalivibrio sp.]|nr:nucleoside deaminase [Thioalkalivibrio sp.]
MNPDDGRMTVRLIQPDWLRNWLRRPSPAADDRARLAEVIALAGANVDHDLGGPFAAAVYALDDGRRLSAAVNTTIASHCSAAHAELQALSLAQQAMGTHTLESRPCVLVSSSAPCTMCLGAIAWSGVQGLVFSTTRADVEVIGFDEGPATPRWRHELSRRGIAVRGPLLQRAGRAVLARYRDLGGVIYNPHAAPGV